MNLDREEMKEMILICIVLILIAIGVVLAINKVDEGCKLSIKQTGECNLTQSYHFWISKNQCIKECQDYNELNKGVCVC